MNDWRARIGFLIPPTNPTVEKEMFELAPEGVSVHFARMVAKGPVGTLDNLHQRAASHLEHLGETIEMLASVEPDVIVLAHTATSYILGPKGERELTARMEKLTGGMSQSGELIAELQKLAIFTDKKIIKMESMASVCKGLGIEATELSRSNHVAKT